jgi:DNA-directed RNA polymerase specialized sigma24 family protein
MPERASPERRLSPQELERFNACVLPYLDAAYNLARYLLRDPHEAEDAVQESFLRGIRHFDGFRGVDGRAWLLSIVRNTCFTQLRRRRPDFPDVPLPRLVAALGRASQYRSRPSQSIA